MGRVTRIAAYGQTGLLRSIGCREERLGRAEAYEVLSDAEKRKQYDQFGHEGLRGAGMHDFSRMNVEDIFSMFGFDDFFSGIFGGGRRGGGRRGGPARGYDLETGVELTLAEIAHGAEKTIEFTRQDRCPDCTGSGAAAGSQPTRCSLCGGTGQVAKGGGFFQMVSACPQCRGEGKVVTDPCRKCKGSGRVPKKRTVTIKVPAGVHEGQGIRVGGEGEPGRSGGPNGDLYCYVRVKPHEFLERDGNTLIAIVQLKIPPGTQYGSLFRIRGQGLPDMRSGRRGDQLVQVTVETPANLNTKQEELLRQFAQTENKRVSPKSQGFFEKLKRHFGNH